MNKDINKLAKAIKIAEREGPLESQNELWSKVSRIYNSSIGDKFVKLSTQAVCHAVKRSDVLLNIVKTPIAKSGRPSKKSAVAEATEFMQEFAIKNKWNCNDSGWETINRLRRLQRKKEVEPVDYPDENTFA